MKTDALGVDRNALLQLRVVILMCSSTCMRMDALGISGLVMEQLDMVILMCSSTPGRMDAPGISGGFGMLQKNQSESGWRRTEDALRTLESMMITMT